MEANYYEQELKKWDAYACAALRTGSFIARWGVELHKMAGAPVYNTDKDGVAIGAFGVRWPQSYMDRIKQFERKLPEMTPNMLNAFINTTGALPFDPYLAYQVASVVLEEGSRAYEDLQKPENINELNMAGAVRKSVAGFLWRRLEKDGAQLLNEFMAVKAWSARMENGPEEVRILEDQVLSHLQYTSQVMKDADVYQKMWPNMLLQVSRFFPAIAAKAALGELPTAKAEMPVSVDRSELALLINIAAYHCQRLRKAGNFRLALDVAREINKSVVLSGLEEDIQSDAKQLVSGLQQDWKAAILATGLDQREIHMREFEAFNESLKRDLRANTPKP